MIKYNYIKNIFVTNWHWYFTFLELKCQIKFAWNVATGNLVDVKLNLLIKTLVSGVAVLRYLTIEIPKSKSLWSKVGNKIIIWILHFLYIFTLGLCSTHVEVIKGYQDGKAFIGLKSGTEWHSRNVVEDHLRELSIDPDKTDDIIIQDYSKRLYEHCCTLGLGVYSSDDDDDDDDDSNDEDKRAM